MKRCNYLDTAKGIGMMLVVIAHSAGLSKYLIYYFIQLFFIISGYLYKPGRSYGENIKRKAIQLLIPYFSCNLFLLLFFCMAGRSASETMHSAFGIFYSRYCLNRISVTPTENNIFFFDIANGGTWYLTAFFTSSVVYYFVIDVCLKGKRNVIFMMSAFTVITMALSELPVLLPWSIDVAFVGALFMVTGTLLKKIHYFDRPCHYMQVILIFACYMILTTINPGINTSAREYGIYGKWSVPLFILIGITGSIICIWIAVLIQETAPGVILAYIGRNTLVLLAFHILILELFEMAAVRFIEVENLSGPAFVLYHTVRITIAVCGSLSIGKSIETVKHFVFRKA